MDIDKVRRSYAQAEATVKADADPALHRVRRQGPALRTGCDHRRPGDVALSLRWRV
jgi:hypothetical protein